MCKIIGNRKWKQLKKIGAKTQQPTTLCGSEQNRKENEFKTGAVPMWRGQLAPEQKMENIADANRSEDLKTNTWDAQEAREGRPKQVRRAVVLRWESQDEQLLSITVNINTQTSLRGKNVF